MKIIHVADTSIYDFDGISTYINELLKSGEEIGDELLLLCNNPLDESSLRKIYYHGPIKTFKSIRAPKKPKLLYSFTKGIEKQIEDFNPDLIWIHTIGTIATKVAKIAKGKYNVIYTKHCFDGELWCLYLNVPKPFHWIFHLAANYFEKIIAKSCTLIVYHIRDTSKIVNRPYFNKFVKFPPPLQSKFFENKVERKAIENKLTLGFCGRYEPDKGIDDTYKSLKIFHKAHPEIELEFILIGDGPEASVLKNRYKFLKTTVTGYIDNVIPFLDKLDGYILSSKHENISLSSLEAFARGIPVFSLPIGYLSEEKDLSNFYLFRSHEQLAGLLEKLFINEKKNEKVPEKNILNNLVISYSELLMKVTEKVKDYF
jgi:glycosyltransferase involved in cell wall biosynthesis